MIALNENYSEKVKIVLVYLAFFSLPVNPKIIIAIIILMGAINFYKLIYHSKVKFLIKPLIKWVERDVISLLFILTFLSVFIGLLISTDIGSGLALLDKYMFFLLCPLALYDLRMTKKMLSKALLFLSASTFIMIMINYALHLNKYSTDIYYTDFDLIYAFHPTYSSLLISIVVIYAIHRLPSYKIGTIKHSSLLLIIFVSVITLFILSSRIVLFICILSIFISTLYQKKNIYLMLPLLIIGIIFLFNSNTTLNRLKSSIDYLENEKDVSYGYGGSKLRIDMWSSVKDTIWKNWLVGLGTSSNQDTLKHNFRGSNLHIPYRDSYNIHNQFIQSIYMNGLIPFIYLVFIFIMLIKIAIKHKDPVIFHVGVLFLGIFIVETLIFRQRGAILFTFITYTLSTYTKDINNEDSNTWNTRNP